MTKIKPNRQRNVRSYSDYEVAIMDCASEFEGVLDDSFLDFDALADIDEDE